MTLQEQIEHGRTHLECDSSFRSCIKQFLEELPVTPIQLANTLAVSRSTVERWKAGTAAPHPQMRKPVYKILEDFRVENPNPLYVRT